MFTDLGTMAMFSVLRDYLRSLLTDWVDDSFARMVGMIGVIGVTMLTLWIMIQGYCIMTGQSREPLLGFITQAAKMIVILSIASSVTLYNNYVRDGYNAVRADLTQALTGSDDDVYDTIDKNLAMGQAILAGVNAIATGLDQASSSEQTDKSLILWATAFGTSAPAVVAGVASLLNEFVLAPANILGPLMLLCYLFEPTRQLFWNWVRITIAVTILTIALSVMTGFTLKIITAYAAAMLATSFLDVLILDGGHAKSLASSAFMLGGLGLTMTLLLVTVPPVVMIFFQAQLGGAINGWNSFSMGVKDGGNNISKAPGPGLPGEIQDGNKQINDVDMGNEVLHQIARRSQSSGMPKTSQNHTYRATGISTTDVFRRN